VGLSLTGAVAAQSSGTGPGTTRGTASPSVTSPTGAPTSPSAAQAATHELKVVRLSKLDDVNVYDSSQKKIGEVDDMVLDPASGRVLHALVSIGGVLGVGDKKYEVPTKDLKAFSKSADDSVPAKVTLATPPDKLTEAKKLDKDSPNVLASKLIGTDVDDSQGKDIGEIKDVIVDLQSGEVQFAMVEFEESVAPDDKLFAFKMSEFQKGKDDKKLVLNVTKDSVNKVPSIEKGRIDKIDLSESSWAQAPGQAAGAASASGGSTTAGSTPAAGQSGSTATQGTSPGGASTGAAGGASSGAAPKSN
jgi:sporulation protein YlmC with PRC-barrel domain